MFSACTPDEYEMGSKAFAPEDLVEGVAYSVTHDANNPNIVYLKSLLGPEYTPLWEHPQGRSQEAEVTLQMPFEGRGHTCGRGHQDEPRGVFQR